jgi:hypothetical protein
MCGLYASALAVLQLLIGKRCELPDMPVCFAHISGAVSGLLVGFGDRVTLHGCSRRGFVHKLNIFVRVRIAASSLSLSLLSLRRVLQSVRASLLRLTSADVTDDGAVYQRRR